MKGWVSFALLGALVLVQPGAAAAEMHGGHASLEQLVVESADTPAEHHALAEHFKRKAEHAREMAERHRAMAKAYSGNKVLLERRMKDHCDKLAELNDTAAVEYDKLAEGHAEQAKR